MGSIDNRSGEKLVIGPHQHLRRFGITAGILFIALVSLMVYGCTSPARAQQAGGTDSDTSTPAKLYQAVTGYLSGIRGQDKPEPRRTQRPPNPPAPQPVKTSPSSTPSAKSIFEKEAARADLLFQRKDWDEAVTSLERALKAAEKMETVVDTAPLQDKLRQARYEIASAVGAPPTTLGEILNSIGMKMILIRPGTFVMGSSDAEIRELAFDWNVETDLVEPEQPAHTVRINQIYFIGKYEVTVAQFRRFVEETGHVTVAEKQGWGWVFDRDKKGWIKQPGASWKNPGFPVRDDHPVTLVAYTDAEAFCEWLSKKDGRRYYLPTEAQWEYAARGGKPEKRFPWGDRYPDGGLLNTADRESPVPWADRTIIDGFPRVAPVGGYEPNDFWLYDMAGNVWEFCYDNYSEREYENTEKKITEDPFGPRRGKKRVVRGGNWAFGPLIARNAFRFGLEPDVPIDINGFRVAAVASDSELRAFNEANSESDSAPTPNESIVDIVNRIKNLVARGKRLEARRLAEKALAETSPSPTGNPDDRRVLEVLLTSLIDTGEDERSHSFTNSLGLNMIRIPSGSFVMGSSESDIAWAMTVLAQGQPVSLENEYPFHKVRISRPFFISSTEVTVGMFRTFVEETGYVSDAEADGTGQVFDTEEGRFEVKEGATWRNPGWDIEDSQPVVLVSHNDAQAFCDWLTAREKLPYKLPTEAQWEYAARGGIPMAPFPWGDALPDGEKANFADKNTDFEWSDEYADDGYQYVAPVGSYAPNNFGLYDMAGNVLEWTRDHYGEDYYRFTPEVDPEGPKHGEYRVTKGGEWTFGPVNLRCAFRGWSRPELSFYNTGFRVVVDLAETRRRVAFTEDFLTREWSPGPDQREVAQAVARHLERTGKREFRRESKSTQQVEIPAEPPIQGVRILQVTPKSDARDAGMQVNDVIIEYDGTRNLTSDLFLALTKRTKEERTRPMVVFVRDGFEYSVRTAPGFLGVTVMNTRVRGPFKKPREKKPEQRRQRRDSDESLDWT